MVAPFAGAWIEIQPYLGRQKFGTVAPFAGAWIEIYTPSFAPIIKPSLPSRERGLKSPIENDNSGKLSGRSLRGSVD